MIKNRKLLTKTPLIITIDNSNLVKIRISLYGN